MKPPKECRDMHELRAAIDLLDAEIVALIARRAGYIDRAIELKPAVHMPARVTARVNEVLEKVQDQALKQGLDPVLVHTLWRVMIEWSIAREEKILGPKQG